MSSDRYVNCARQVMVAALCVLVLFQVEGMAMAEEGGMANPSIRDGERELPAAEPLPSLYPLRWRVSHFSEMTNGPYCVTVVVVQNPTANPDIVVNLNWFASDGTTRGSASRPLVAHDMEYVISDNDVNPAPFSGNFSMGLDDYTGGYVEVRSDEPRIIVTAHLVCKDGLGTGKNLVAITSIPTFPVGATLEHFQAGMRAALTPPVGNSEMPQ